MMKLALLVLHPIVGQPEYKDVTVAPTRAQSGHERGKEELELVFYLTDCSVVQTQT